MTLDPIRHEGMSPHRHLHCPSGVSVTVASASSGAYTRSWTLQVTVTGRVTGRVTVTVTVAGTPRRTGPCLLLDPTGNAAKQRRQPRFAAGQVLWTCAAPGRSGAGDQWCSWRPVLETSAVQAAPERSRSLDGA